jgi:hypothetical protein
MPVCYCYLLYRHYLLSFNTTRHITLVHEATNDRLYCTNTNTYYFLSISHNDSSQYKYSQFIVNLVLDDSTVERRAVHCVSVVDGESLGLQRSMSSNEVRVGTTSTTAGLQRTHFG